MTNKSRNANNANNASSNNDTSITNIDFNSVQIGCTWAVIRTDMKVEKLEAENNELKAKLSSLEERVENGNGK